MPISRTCWASEELLKAVVISSPDPAPASWQVAESAARQALSQRSFQLSLAQYQALADDRIAYSCHVILCQHEKAGSTRPILSSMVGTSGKPSKRLLPNSRR